MCKNNDHTCLFHCINTCRVPRMMLNTGPISLVFKQHPRDPTNVNALKNMCDPYNHAYNWIAAGKQDKNWTGVQCIKIFNINLKCKHYISADQTQQSDQHHFYLLSKKNFSQI